MNTDIIQHENDILRQKAKPVPEDEIGSRRISKVIESMKIALAEQLDGVAIAAPQIGESLRIFVVAGKVYDRLEDAGHEDEEDTRPPEKETPPRNPDKVFINPKIIKTSKTLEEMDEGCLSVRNYYGTIRRHSKVTVTAFDEHGAPFTEGRSGLLAQIFQHEIDHLDGVLFIDKATGVEYRDPNTDNEDADEL